MDTLIKELRSVFKDEYIHLGKTTIKGTIELIKGYFLIIIIINVEMISNLFKNRKREFPNRALDFVFRR